VEQSLIGALLLEKTAWDTVADVVHESDFYRDDHRRIFRHIGRLAETNQVIDILTVSESIERSNETEQSGGLAYLGEIANNTVSAANVRRYAEIIRDKAILRRLLAASDEIAGIALNPQGKDTKQVLDEAETKIFAIAEMGAKATQGFVTVQSVLSEVVDKVQQAYESDEPLAGTATGFNDLDALTCGLTPGDMIVVAGRPSMGKTAFALNVAEHVATVLGLPVGIFSLEMSNNQIGARLLSSSGRVEQQKLRTGKLGDDDWDRLTVALGTLHVAPLHIDESGALNISDLRARARRLHRQCGKLGLIVIDYLQLMSANREGENRATEISGISRSIKALAKELQVPIMALSQLSRKVEERVDKRPLMSDLRESGAIEQDADIVLMMYRDEYYKPDTQDKGIAEIIIAKHRNGPTGFIRLQFQGEVARFNNLATGGYSRS